MAENKYLKSSEPPAEVQKEPVKPVAKTTLKKKGFFRKTKDFLFSGDTRDVKDYIIEETIKPTIRDGIYDIVMNFVEGMIFGETSRRRRKSSGNKYEKNSSYTSYYKNNSKYEKEDRRERRERSRGLDLDNIEFCDPDKNARENWEDAIDVKAGMVNRINRYGSASVQDLADFVGVTSDQWMSVEWGWDDVEEFESGCDIKKVRGGAIMMLPAPRHLDD